MDIVGWPCVFMLVEGVVFFLITLFIEYHEGVLRQTGQAAEMPSDQDKDVLEGEKQSHTRTKISLEMSKCSFVFLFMARAKKIGECLHRVCLSVRPLIGPVPMLCV